MKLRLSRDEQSTLLLGITMFIFVPSAKVTKAVLSGHEKEILEDVDRRLSGIFKDDRETPRPYRDLDLAPQEIDLLVKIIESDIRQCGTDDSEYSAVNYRVHFGKERKKVESLLAKLVACVTP